MRSSDWSSDVCSSDLLARGGAVPRAIIGGAQEAAALDDIILAACLACRPFPYIADKVVDAMLVGREAGDRRAPGKTVGAKVAHGKGTLIIVVDRLARLVELDVPVGAARRCAQIGRGQGRVRVWQ